VLAEPTLALPGHPEVFVVGDVCALEQDGQWLPGVAQVARQQGVHAAANVLRHLRGEPLAPFHYRDYGSMATIGRGAARDSLHGCYGSSSTSSGSSVFETGSPCWVNGRGRI
jgi:NADH dehydrogenase